MHFESNYIESENFNIRGPVTVESKKPGLHIIQELKVESLHVENNLYLEMLNIQLEPTVAEGLADQLQVYIDATKISFFDQAVSNALSANTVWNDKIRLEVGEQMIDLREDGYFTRVVELQLPDAIEKIPTPTMDTLIDRMFDRILERDSTMIQRLEAKIRQHKLQRFQLAVEENEENGNMRPE